jgi:hypothetical protein
MSRGGAYSNGRALRVLWLSHARVALHSLALGPAQPSTSAMRTGPTINTRGSINLSHPSTRQSTVRPWQNQIWTECSTASARSEGGTEGLRAHAILKRCVSKVYELVEDQSEPRTLVRRDRRPESGKGASTAHGHDRTDTDENQNSRFDRQAQRLQVDSRRRRGDETSP